MKSRKTMKHIFKITSGSPVTKASEEEPANSAAELRTFGLNAKP